MLVAACASKPTIESDYDHTIDFSKYKTYGFFNPMGIENPNYSSIYGSIFREAIGQDKRSTNNARLCIKYKISAMI